MAVEAPATGLWIVGDVTVGFPASRTGYGQQTYGNTEPPTQRATWLRVGEDGRVTLYAGKVEYGQNIRTGLAVEVADELRVRLADVDVILGDTDLVPWDMGTFGSQSTARVGLQLRKAAATARNALLELAADRLDLPASELECREGLVRARNGDGRTVPYADLVGDTEATREIDDEVELTPAAEFSIMGTAAGKIDASDIVTGRTVYSQDVQLPDMLFAAVLRPPATGARLIDADTSIAERMPGVRQIAREDYFIAVLADTDEQAEQALGVIQARWEEPAKRVSHLDLPELLVHTADEGFVTQEAGSLKEGFRAADGVLEATYFAPYISNAVMEPRAAVAQWRDGRLTVWAGTQRPFGIRTELAQHFGLDESDVRVIAPEIGGGFGSKSPYTVAIEAARLAKIAGRPVRVAYTRTEEMAWATFRPAALFQVKSGFTSDGKLVAWECRGYHAGDRPFLGRRGAETPYDVPHVRVTAYTSQSPLRTGSYRSLGGAANHFARESHMDEIAADLGVDPVALRLRNLSHPRFRGVLEQAAARFGWTPGAAPSRRGIGCALAFDVGSYAAACFELDVAGAEVNIGRVVLAADCGQIVNPVGVENQVEGAIMMGIGTGLYEAAEFRAGRLLTSSFARYRVPRMLNLPQIEVVLTGDQSLPSTGAGEVGIVPVTAAIANALFDLTGQRIRELPVQPRLGKSGA